MKMTKQKVDYVPEEVKEKAKMNKFKRGLKLAAIGAGLLGAGYLLGMTKGTTVGFKLGLDRGRLEGFENAAKEIAIITKQAIEKAEV
jgi:hypothetical protein